jgi:hypothetical protein
MTHRSHDWYSQSSQSIDDAVNTAVAYVTSTPGATEADGLDMLSKLLSPHGGGPNTPEGKARSAPEFLPPRPRYRELQELQTSPRRRCPRVRRTVRRSPHSIPSTHHGRKPQNRRHGPSLVAPAPLPQSANFGSRTRRRKRLRTVPALRNHAAPQLSNGLQRFSRYAEGAAVAALFARQYTNRRTWLFPI